MLSNYIFANLGFAISAGSILVFFATGWLYLDSWKVAKETKDDLEKSIGFFLLAFVAVVQASLLEIPVLSLVAQIAKIIALILLIRSFATKPAIRSPKNFVAVIFPFIFLANLLVPFSAILLLLLAFRYFQKSVEVGAREYKPIALAFLFLALFELINIAFFWQNTLNPFWSQILALYGPVWTTSRIVELVGLVILARWTWGYLRFRATAQLFILTVSAAFGFFVITTISFTFLLLHGLEQDALSHLRTDVRVVQYAIERLQKEALATATAVSENSEIKKAFSENNKANLYTPSSNLMLAYATNFLAVTNSTGKVIMRGEDKENIGDTLIFDPTVKSALGGQRLATVISQEGAIAPQIQIKSSVPLYKNTKVQGAVSTGFLIDSAFVDGIKTVTGLDISIFGGNKRAATTFVAPDGKTRFIGSLETNPDVIKTVLEKGEIFVGATNIFNKPYYVAYAPLMTYPDKVIGMIFVGKLQTELFEVAQKSLQLTFIGSMILMILSLVPAYFLSRYIKENIKA